jgi:hypothetical protein
MTGKGKGKDKGKSKSKTKTKTKYGGPSTTRCALAQDDASKHNSLSSKQMVRE